MIHLTSVTLAIVLTTLFAATATSSLRPARQDLSEYLPIVGLAETSFGSQDSSKFSPEMLSSSFGSTKNGGDSDTGLDMPEMFASPEHLRSFLTKLNAHYAIAGRPRFGKRSHRQNSIFSPSSEVRKKVRLMQLSQAPYQEDYDY